MISTNFDFGKVKCDFPLYFSKEIGKLYSNFNKEHFDKEIVFDQVFKNFLDTIYNFHSQNYIAFNTSFIERKELQQQNNTVVVLGYSGGLDSTYQALKLKEEGYNVILFYCSGINTYENYQADKVAKEFSEKFNFSIEFVKISKVIKKTEQYKQFWHENPIKNQFIISLMIDFCLEKGYNIISLGDDLSLDIKNVMLGVNLTDAKQTLETFLSGCYSVFKNLQFKEIKCEGDKAERLNLLNKYKALEHYYSCVSPGKFVNYWHKINSEKYGVKLPTHNCYTCRKCAMHGLILNKIGLVELTRELESRLWEKLWKGHDSADYVFFGPHLTQEQREYNLTHY